MTEEEYLELIEGKLETAIENIEHEMKLNDRDIAQLQELYWENNSDFDEYGYEEYENRQQMFNHANFRSRNMKTLHMYKKMQDSPYFARVDFLFDGDDEPECCYITSLSTDSTSFTLTDEALYPSFGSIVTVILSPPSDSL